jgi:hypothetical protein
VRAADTRKLCIGCELFLPKEDFHVAAPGKGDVSGLSGRCRKCQAEWNKAHYHSNVKKRWTYRILAAVNARHRNPATKKKTAAWDAHEITEALLYDLLSRQVGRCYYTGIEMVLETPRLPWSVSLDRLDCSKGYTKDNVVLACRAANLGRSDSTPDQMLAFIEMIKEV